MSSDVAKLPPELGEHVMAELQRGERVSYAGRPNWRAEWPKLALIFVFGAGWSAVCFPMVFFTGAAALGFIPFKFGGAPASPWVAVLALLFLLPFAAIGLLCLAAPFAGIAKSARTVHVVTDRRILNVYGGHRRGADSYPLATINFVKRKDRRQGSGSLEIGYGVAHDSDGDPRPLQFDWSGIPDVRRAEAAMQ
jgi:hypothetical protein